MWDGKDPFGYPVSQYLWVLGIACIGGLVRHLNHMKQLKGGQFVIDIVTAGFTGVMTFWLCESIHIQGPMSAIMIATGGSMGSRAWREFENLWRLRFGIAADQTNLANMNIKPRRKSDEAKK